MAETGALIGYNTLLEISQDNGATWAEIAEVTDITPPSNSVDLIDATHMRSPNRDREFIAGLNDPGETSFTINFVPGSTTDALLRTVKAAFARVKVRITWPNAVVWTFSGILTAYNPEAPTDDKMTAEVTFKVSGSTVVDNAAVPANAFLPQIAGTAQVGQTLTANPGIWTGGATFAYQWEADGAAISGATSSTYIPVVGQIGDVITVVVTGTNSEGAVTAESLPTAAVIAA